MTWAPLVLIPLLWGLVWPPQAPDPRWRWGRELALTLGCGLGLVLLNGVWLARFHMNGATLTSSDFHEYCSSVAALAWGPAEVFTHQRSAVAALPSALFARHLGLVDGMAWAGLLSTAALGAGLYLWGRAISGVRGGVSAALMAGTLPPLVILSRTLSFYDEMAAAFALGGAGAALALRYRNPVALAAGGAGVGLCLLADFRGLFWAVSFLGLCLAAALWPREVGEGSWPRRLGRWAAGSVLNLGALAGPLWGSFVAGRWAYRFNVSLEEVMAPRQRLVERGFTQPELTAPFHADSAFIWGSTDPRGVPDTLRWVLQESAVIPRESWDNPEVLRIVEAHLGPWLPVWGVALGLAVLGCARGPWRLPRLGALLGTGVPFVLALKGAVEMQRAQLHYQGTALPWAALVLGLGWVSLSEVGSLPGLRRLPEAVAARLPALGRAGPGLRGGALCALLLAVVLGGIPSFLSPTAPWRQRWSTPDAEIRAMLSHARGRPPAGAGRQLSACVEALGAEDSRGFAAEGQLWGGQGGLKKR